MSRSRPVSRYSRLLVLIAALGGFGVEAAEPGNDVLMILLEQNRNLQAEVQALRALVEEQGFELRRLQRESLDRYTDLDNRLGSLEQRQAASNLASAPPVATDPVTPPAGATPIVNTDPAAVPAEPGSRATGSVPGVVAAPDSGTRPTLQPDILSEQELYQMAYESAINSQFDLAIAQFDQYLSVYPSGRFTTNAHYWKGQSYLYLSRFQEAIAAYELILRQYPDAAKVPDAMYGLGVAYEGIGNLVRAREVMQEIKRRYPNTGVANLADTRLLSLNR